MYLAKRGSRDLRKLLWLAQPPPTNSNDIIPLHTGMCLHLVDIFIIPLYVSMGDPIPILERLVHPRRDFLVFI